MTNPAREDSANGPPADRAGMPHLDLYARARIFGGLAIVAILAATAGVILHLHAVATTGQDLLAGWEHESLFISLIAAAAISSVVALLVSLRRTAERMHGHAVMLQDAVDGGIVGIHADIT